MSITANDPMISSSTKQSIRNLPVGNAQDSLHHGVAFSPLIPMDKQTLGAMVVSKSLGCNHCGPNCPHPVPSDMNQTSDLARTVLGAYAKGSLINTII